MRTLGIAILLALPQELESPKGYASTKEAMTKVQLLVGSWRCTATPRELRREPWVEKMSWEFRIEKETYSLVMTAADAVFWNDAVLAYDVKRKRYTLDASLVPGGTRRYEGRLHEKDRDLILEQVPEAWPRERVIFSLLRDNRHLVTFESQAEKGRDWGSLAILGCTKEGVPFVRGVGPVCVVTGGAGTIAVEYKGKTYYVC